MYSLETIKFVLLLVVIRETETAKLYEAPNYCNMATWPICLNKPHLLCNPKHSSKLSFTDSNAVTMSLIEFRENIRKFQNVCNLKDLQWNDELAKMAGETFDKIYQDSCSITTNFKNTLYFSHSFYKDENLTLPENNIRIGLNSLTKSINTRLKVKGANLSWIFSAYSTQIGCYKTYGNRLNCIINGIELKYYGQSFGHGTECDLSKSVIGIKVCIIPELINIDHFMSNPFQEFPNPETIQLDFTTTKFIITKFEWDNQNVVWDNDLQYFAERIVTRNLTENDKCLAREQYPIMLALHFYGDKNFTDLHSNIDNVWSKRDIHKRIGCVPFYIFETDSLFFHLYCLTGNLTEPPESSFIQNFLEFIGFEPSDYWLIYVLTILTCSDIIAVLVLFYCIKAFERKRIFSFNDF